MKERTRNYFELAESDLTVANENVESKPNIAAFHAQQCAEKALKAMVWELSDIEDEDELISKIKHDSIRAVNKVLTQAVKDSMQGSGYYSLGSKLRKQKDAPGGSLALLIYLASSMSFEKVFQLFERMTISKDQDYWGRSLDANLKPDPTFNKQWMNELDTAGEFTNALLDFLTFAAREPISPFSEVGATERVKSLKVWLEKTAQDFASKGQRGEAESARKALRQLDKFANPDSPFIEWMKLVIFSAPYLDAHAVRARYATSKELRKYQKYRNGVRNLVSISKQVLDQSKSVLVVLTRED
jgi:HEPN domain-containing protein